MKVETFDQTQEHAVLTSMVTRDVVLGRVTSCWKKPGLFLSKYANVVGYWCVQYFDKYQRAPGPAVVKLFRAWAEKVRDQDTVDAVEKFLSSLSDQYERNGHTPPDALSIDEAGELFSRNALVLLSEEIKDDLEAGEVARGKERVHKFSSPSLGVGAGVSVTDPGFVKQVFTATGAPPLVRYPGGLGRFFGRALSADNFIAFCAPEKAGKTWWLLDLAWRAATQKRRVAFFEVGDMSEQQVGERLAVRAAKHPLLSPDGTWPCQISVPTDIIAPDDHKGCATPQHQRVCFDRPLSEERAQQCLERFVGRGGECFLRLSCHPGLTVGVRDLSSILQSWRRQEGWVPDIVVVDYADDLAPPEGVRDKLEATGTNWKLLRSLNLSLHCLLVTATQARRVAYDAKHTMTKDAVSEDKRKLAAVTGMVGINVRNEEKELGLARLNWMALRGSEFSEKKCVHVAGCLALANPALCSTF